MKVSLTNRGSRVLFLSLNLALAGAALAANPPASPTPSPSPSQLSPAAALPTSVPSSVAHPVARVLDIKTKSLLFTVDRQVVSEGGDHRRRILEIFRDPDGQVAARAEAVLEGEDRVVEYSVDKLQTGEKGKIDVQGNQIHFWFKDRKGQVKTGEEKLDGNFVVGLSIRDFVRANWKDLMGGKSVDLRFGVPERQETVGFEIFKDRETRDAKGRNLAIFKMKPTSIFIAALVRPIYFAFDKSNENLVEFNGRTIPYRKVGDKFEDLDAVTIYSE